MFPQILFPADTLSIQQQCQRPKTWDRRSCCVGKRLKSLRLWTVTMAWFPASLLRFPEQLSFLVWSHVSGWSLTCSDLYLWDSPQDRGAGILGDLSARVISIPVKYSVATGMSISECQCPWRVLGSQTIWKPQRFDVPVLIFLQSAWILKDLI